jgi:hypothetical protein
MKIGASDISHVHKIAGLLAIAVDDQALALYDTAAEDGHHAGLTLWVLTRTVDVGIPQDHVAQTVNLRVIVEIVLCGELCHTIRAQRPSGVRLRCRKARLFSVDRTTRRREDQHGHMVMADSFQQVEHTQDVHRGIPCWICDRLADIYLSGVMAHTIESVLGNEGPQVRRPEVHADELRTWVDLFTFAAREIVQDPHVMPGLDVSVHHVGSNEAGTTTDYDAHIEYLESAEWIEFTQSVELIESN